MTLNIAICDDEALQTEYLKTLVTEWAKQSGNGVKISTYPSAESFLFDYSEDMSHDILLLDVEMGNINGIELAKTVRKNNSTVQIIFVTGYYQYFSDGFDVSALHYLLKPVSKEKLFPVLFRAANNLAQKERSVLIQTDAGIVRVALEDILWLESDRMHTFIHTKTEVFRTRKGISKFENELDRSFYQIHRSFIVNLKFISRITRTEVYIQNGEVLPLSRGKYDELHAALINNL